jgi:hypothetical protein
MRERRARSEEGKAPPHASSQLATLSFRMASITEWSILAESAATELDLPRNLGNRGLDRVAGVVQDYHRALDDDGAGGFKRERDGLRRRFFGHAEI